MNSFKTRFPKNANDGDEILDINGNIYKYNAEEDTWNVLGLISLPGPVSKNSDGIVNVQLFKKLKLIEKLIDDDYDFRLFKLKYETDNPPYNFVFYSHDDLIKFSIEDNYSIRMEVNYNKLYQKLLKICCKGPKGPVGDKGDKGTPGTPSYNEQYKTIKIISQNEFIIEDIVNVPITTEISIRCFLNKSQIIEVNLNLDGSYEILEDVKIDKSKSKFNISVLDKKATINGNIVLIDKLDLSKVEFKARQRGRQGDKGENGRAFFVIKEQLIDDTNVSSRNAIVSIRKSNLNNNIFYFETPMHNEVCVSNLKSISSDEIFSQYTIENINFVGVEPTIRDCKYIGYHKFELLEDQINDYLEINKLELPSWTPTRDCVLSHRYGQYKFDWYNKTTDKYPYKIRPNPPPPESCGCVEDFFFCPNVGDIPCAIEGEVSAPTTTRFSDCECVSPIEGEIQGSGYFLGNIKSCDTGTNTVSTTGCVNGVINTIYSNAEVCGNCQIRIILNKDFSMFDSEQEMINGDLYQDENDVHSTIVIGSSNNFISITDGGISELSSIEDEMIFYVNSGAADCAKDNLTINVSVNDTNKNYCYGYKLTIIANCNCVNDGSSGSEPGTGLSSGSGSETITSSSFTEGAITGSGSEGIIDGFVEGQIISGRRIIDEIYLNYDYIISDSMWIVSELNDSIQMSFKETNNPDYFFDIPSFFAPVDDDVVDGMKIVFDKITFLKEKSVKDDSGPFGDGYYFIRDDFDFKIYSYVNSKKRPIRIDTWTDLIFFASEKKSNKRAYKFYARLKESVTEFGTGSPILDKMASIESGAVLSIEWDYTDKDLISEFNEKLYPVLNDGKLNIAYGNNIIYYKNENFKDNLPGEFNVESIFPSGKLVYGGVSINELMLGLSFDIKKSSWISTGPDIIAIAIDDSSKPYYKSNIIDLSQNDGTINDFRIVFDDILISAFNAVEDEDGPLGEGFYFARKYKFKTYIYNKYKNTPIRTDIWTNIVFYSTILSNGLRSYSLYARLNNSLTGQETNSPIMDRLAVITSGGILRIEWIDNKSDLIKTYKDGLFIDFENGRLDIFYGRKIEFFTSRGFETSFPVENIPDVVPVKRFFPVSASISDAMVIADSSNGDDRLFEVIISDNMIGTTTVPEPLIIGSVEITESTTHIGTIPDIITIGSAPISETTIITEPYPPRIIETLPPISETISIAEPYPPRIIETTTPITETITFVEPVPPIPDWILESEINETISIAEPYPPRIIETLPPISETISIAEPVPPISDWILTPEISEAISITEPYPPRIIETITPITETISIAEPYPPRIIETLPPISETISITEPYPPRIIETVPISEAISITEPYPPRIIETITPITETISIAEPYPPRVAETLPPITETISITEPYPPRIIETVPISEAISITEPYAPRVAETLPPISETISIAEPYAPAGVEIMSISETISIAEPYPPRVAEIVPISENINFDESTTNSRLFEESISESLINYDPDYGKARFVDKTTKEQTTTGAAIVIDKPSVAVGDIMIALVLIDRGSASTVLDMVADDNWETIASGRFHSNRRHYYVLSKVVDGTELSTMSFGPVSGSQIGCIGSIISLRGILPGTIVAQGPYVQSATTTNAYYDSTDLTTPNTPMMVVSFLSNNSGTHSNWKYETLHGEYTLQELVDYNAATESLSLAAAFGIFNENLADYVSTSHYTISTSSTFLSVSLAFYPTSPHVNYIGSASISDNIVISRIPPTPPADDASMINVGNINESMIVAEPYQPRVAETLSPITEITHYIDPFIGPDIIDYVTNEETTNGILELLKPECKIGDTLIASISIDMGTDVGLSTYLYTNDTWTDINHSGFVVTFGSRIHTHTYYKIVDGNEPDTFEFGPESGIQIGSIGTIFSIRGLTAGTILQEGPTNSSGNSGTVSTSSLTMDSNHMPWISILYTNAKSTYSNWTNNLIEISSFAGATENLSMAVGWKMTHSGSTGTATTTLSGSTEWHSVSIGLISSPPAVVNTISKTIEESIGFTGGSCLNFNILMDYNGAIYDSAYHAGSYGSLYSSSGWDYEDWAGTAQIQTYGHPDIPDTGVGTLSETATACSAVITLDVTGLWSTANTTTLYVYVTNPGGRQLTAVCQRSLGGTGPMTGPLATNMNSTGWHLIDFPYDVHADDVFRVTFNASGASSNPVGIHQFYVEFNGDCT